MIPADKTAMLDAALAYAAAYDWWVFPADKDKHPLTTHGFKDATQSITKIRGWWSRWPSANIGISTGASALVVIDLDVKDGRDGIAEWRKLCEGQDPIQTAEARTPSGGKHLYFEAPDMALITCSAGKLAPGIDVRADGGYIVLPPSKTDAGQYQWTSVEWYNDMIPLPGWLCERIAKPDPKPAPPPMPSHDTRDLTPYIQAAVDGEVVAVRAAENGTRNATLNEAAYSLARLLSHGLTEDRIVDELLRAAVDAGLPEREVRQTIASGIKAGREHPRQIPEGREDRKTAATVAALNVIENPEPLRLAERLLRDRFTHNGALTLRRHSEQWHRYTGTHYELVSDEALGAEIYKHVDNLQTPKRDANGNPLFGADGKPVCRKVRANKSTVIEVAAAAVACGTWVDGIKPRWLRGEDQPDPREILACRNGLLHVPSRRLLPHTADFFSNNALGFDYEPGAGEPREWLKFLLDLWPDDPQSSETLQEWFGYLLTPDTRQQKILLLCGPKRSGKGTIARTLTALLGASNVAGPSLASLGLDFGLQSLLDKIVAIISDARIGGRSDGAIITERLLSISGEDLQTVDRKHLPAVHATLPIRFVLLTNELPRLADTSGALASRFIVLTLTRSFLGHEDHGLTSRLLKELPGIFTWALTGYERLNERGHFVQPQSATEAVRELEDLGSPIGAFVRECCIVRPGVSIPVSRLFEAWGAWCKDKGRDHSGTVQSFARDLRAALPGIRTSQPRDEAGRQSARFYEGVTLNVF